MREFLFKMLFCELIGYSVPFGYIHAISMTQNTILKEKCLGYLCSSIFLRNDHEYTLLLLNSLQRNLKSRNVIDIYFTLTCLASLLNKETIPIIIEELKKRVDHSSSLIRKKAFIVINRCIQKDSINWWNFKQQLQKGLEDEHLSVLHTIIQCFLEILNRDKSDDAISFVKSNFKSLLKILYTICHSHIPSIYIRKKTPANWTQITILRIFAILGKNDSDLSKEMFDVFKEILDQEKLQTIGAYSILYECVKTIMSVQYNEEMLRLASRTILSFLKSEKTDLKYIGISLAMLMDASFIIEHESVFLECLNTNNENIQRKVLNLFCNSILKEQSLIRKIVPIFIQIIETKKRTKFIDYVISKLIMILCSYNNDVIWIVNILNRMIFLNINFRDLEKLIYHIVNLVSTSNEDIKKEIIQMYSTLEFIQYESSWLSILLSQLFSEVELKEYKPSYFLKILCNRLLLFPDDEIANNFIVNSISKLCIKEKQLNEITKSTLAMISSRSDMVLASRIQELFLIFNSKDLIENFVFCKNEDDLNSLLNDQINAYTNEMIIKFPNMFMNVKTELSYPKKEESTQFIEISSKMSDLKWNPYEAPKSISNKQQDDTNKIIADKGNDNSNNLGPWSLEGYNSSK